MSKIKSKIQVEEAIQCIEARYAIGKEILKECDQRSPRGLITELAEKHGVPRDTRQKLRHWLRVRQAAPGLNCGIGSVDSGQLDSH